MNSSFTIRRFDEWVGNQEAKKTITKTKRKLVEVGQKYEFLKINGSQHFIVAVL